VLSAPAPEQDPCKNSLSQALVAEMDKQGVDVLAYLTFNNPPIIIGDGTQPSGGGTCELARRRRAARTR
jgi:hypothetical protein